jgi:hypothetical protein
MSACRRFLRAACSGSWLNIAIRRISFGARRRTRQTAPDRRGRSKRRLEAAAARVSMGTTVVGFVLEDAAVITFNMGDSRAYRLGRGGLLKLSHEDVAVSVCEGRPADGSHGITRPWEDPRFRLRSCRTFPSGRLCRLENGSCCAQTDRRTYSTVATSKACSIFRRLPPSSRRSSSGKRSLEEAATISLWSSASVFRVASWGFMNPGISIRFDTQETHKSPPAPWRAMVSILLTSRESRTIRGRDRCCRHRCYKCSSKEFGWFRGVMPTVECSLVLKRGHRSSRPHVQQQISRVQ